MADDIAKRDFSVILKNLNRKFDITDCKWSKDKIFEIKFRTQISIENNDFNTYCDNWADEFSQVTDTIWVHKISNTGPKVKFRKQYQCWTHEDKEVQKELLFDTRRCRGTLDVKILGDTSAAKKSNKYMRLGMNALVKINFQHLHQVNTMQNYSFFVHQCESQAEPPVPVAESNERISELVAKMVENAAVTSQKAAERAQQALNRQCIVPENSISNIQKALTAVQVPHIISCEQEKVGTVPQNYEPPVTQVILNSSTRKTTETYFVQNVVFDSTTQTIREVIPVAGGTVPNGHQLVQLQMPHISHGLEVPQNGENLIVSQPY